MMKVNRFEKLVKKLCWMDEQFGRRMADFSNASVATDMTRIAVKENRRIPAEVGERAIEKAVRKEGEALAEFVEVIEAGNPSEFEVIVKEMREAGVTVDWNSYGNARWFRDKTFSYLGTRHLTHPIHREMVDRLAKELTDIGVDVS
jgi:hypothetical protein